MSIEELSEVQGRPWDDVDVSIQSNNSVIYQVVADSYTSTDALKHSEDV